MDSFIEQQLNLIEQAARQIVSGIRGIIGYSNGQEMVAQKLFPIQPPIAQGNEFGNQPTISLTEEIKQMIVELKIKGSVRERANGLIELRTQALGSIYGRTKDEIEQKLNERLKEAKSKKKTAKEKNKTPLLSEFFHSEYLPYKKQSLADSSINDLEIEFRFISEKSKFDLPLNKYTAAAIENFLYSIPQTRKRQKIRGVFNNMFTYAKRLGHIKNNPCDNVERMKHEQKQGEAMSFMAQNSFLDALFADTKISLTDKFYLTFVYLTGTRRGEAASVTMQDVDFASNTLHIRGTKTKGSNRVIPLFSLVRRIFEIMNIQHNDLCFPIKPDRVDAIMRRLTNREYHPHELRHTFGTIAICVQKLDAKTVSLYMGHSTVDMTLTRYTHPEQLDKATFYNGALTEEEKLAILREQYAAVLSKISGFLDCYTQ